MLSPSRKQALKSHDPWPHGGASVVAPATSLARLHLGRREGLTSVSVVARGSCRCTCACSRGLSERG